MHDPHCKTYRPWQPELYRRQAQAPAAKLPQDDLVFFLIDLMPHLDLYRFYAPYELETRGAPPFDPAMMVCLLLYSYCLGVRSSRKIARACERNLAFLAIVGEARPDFRTISDFRKQHLEAFIDTFTDVLRLAKEAGLIQLGVLATDGTKMAGDASRHKAMSYGYMVKEVERLRAEIAALVQQAEEVDASEDAALGSRRGDELPAELARREQRLATIAAAKQRLEADAQAAAAAEQQRRDEAERQRTGQPRRGPAPEPIDATPKPKAQTNFTDPELKIMQTNNKGWTGSGRSSWLATWCRTVTTSSKRPPWPAGVKNSRLCAGSRSCTAAHGSCRTVAARTSLALCRAEVFFPCSGTPVHAPEIAAACLLRCVKADAQAGRRPRVKPLPRPRHIPQALQPPPRDVLQAAEQRRYRLAQPRGQALEQTPPFQQLRQDEGDLQQQVIRLPVLRVRAIDMLQVQAAVLLPVEPLILDLPAIPPLLSARSLPPSCG